MKKKGLVFISLFIYKALYEYIYMRGVSPKFTYMDLPYSPNYEKMIISYVALTILIICLPYKRAPVSKYLLEVFLMFTMIPLLSYYWQTNASTEYFVYCIVSFIVMEIIVSLPDNLRMNLRIMLDRGVLEKLDWVFVQWMIIVIMTILIVMKYGAATLAALDLNNVYAVRASRSFEGIYGYMINWIPYAMVPCLLCLSMYSKRWGYAIFAVMVQVYVFLMTGSKTALFSIGLIGAAYFLVERKVNFVFGWCMGLSALNMFTWIIWEKLQILLPFGIFPVRLLSVPAALSFKHYNFFSVNEKLHFSENFVGRILGIQSPYNQISTFMISGGTVNECTGYLGDAFDNGGFVVMVLYSLILALCFRYIDGLYQRMFDAEGKLPALVGILTYSMIYLNDGPLTTLFVTGGFTIILFVLKVQTDKDVYFVKKKKGRKESCRIE